MVRRGLGFPGWWLCLELAGIIVLSAWKGDKNVKSENRRGFMEEQSRESGTVSLYSMCWCKNAELFVLTYGSVVAQLCKDTDDANEVNKQLDRMLLLLRQKLIYRGYNIGVRLIEDFLAKANTGRCRDFRETADVIAKVQSTPFRGLTMRLRSRYTSISRRQWLPGLVMRNPSPWYLMRILWRIS